MHVLGSSDACGSATNDSDALDCRFWQRPHPGRPKNQDRQTFNKVRHGSEARIDVRPGVVVDTISIEAGGIIRRSPRKDI